MAVTALVAGDGLTRSGAFFDPSADWTIAGWFKCPTPGSNYATFFVHGDSLYVNPYVWLGVHTLTGGVTLDAWNGAVSVVATGSWTGGVWAYVVGTYEAATTTLSLRVGSTLLDTAAVDIGSFTFVDTDQKLLGDTYGGAQPGVCAAYVRLWQTVLTSGQILTEKTALAAVHTTNLLCDTPLYHAAYLNDVSGNNEHWALVGAVTTTANPTPSTGFYAGAIGITSSLGRADTPEFTGVLQILKGNAIVLKFVCHWASPFTSIPAPNNPVCELRQYYLQYRANASFVATVPFSGGIPDTSAMPYGFPTQYVDHIPPPSGPLGVINCDNNQTLEMAFRLGTYNAGTGLHAADGYFEVRINGVVTLTISSIALGLNGQDGWDNILIAPSGAYDYAGNNGGMSFAYVNERDVYGAGNYPLVDLDASVETDATLWSDMGGPWARFSQLGTPLTAWPPGKEDDRITANAEYMTLVVSPALIQDEVPPEPPVIPPEQPLSPFIRDNSSIPCCDGGDVPGMGNTPPVSMMSPVWARSCEVGGDVPTAADLTLTEFWDY